MIRINCPNLSHQYYMISSKRQDRLKENQYIFKDKIGSGSFGDVQKCEHRENCKIYAVKCIPVNPLYVDTIEQEANNMLKSNSDYVIELVDHFYDQNQKSYVLVMPYYRMGSFQALMSKDWKLDELLLFFYEIAMALYDLSKYNILHLDIKPENILIQSTGQYVVCDLGCSRKMQNQTNMWMSFNALKVSTTSKGGGTTEYASPDLLLTTEMTPFSDIWSLGIILYKIIYKTHPLMIIPSNYSNRLQSFQKGKINIEYPQNQKVRQLYPIIEIVKNMLVPSKDKSKRIGWNQILDRICQIAKITPIKRPFIVTNYDLLLEYTNKVMLILAAVLHYQDQCKTLLAESGIQVNNVISYSCVYLLSLAKEVLTHTNSQQQDFWQFHLFQTTQKLITKKQKSYAQVLLNQALQLAHDNQVIVEYGNLPIARQKLVYEYGKMLKLIKKVNPPTNAMKRADFKKLLTILQFIFMENKLEYSERKKLRSFVDGLINS